MPRMVNISWTKCDESEVWKALARCTCTPVDPSTIPLPILWDLQIGAKPDTNLRYFEVIGFVPGFDDENDDAADLRRYVAIPEDTTRYETHLSDHLWRWRLYESQWQAFREMLPDEIDAHVEHLIVAELRQLHSVIGYLDFKHAPVQRFYQHGGARGIDLVQHVFEETAMPYELAIERTARVLYKMLVAREVCRTIDEYVNDRWVLATQMELIEFINAHELSYDEDGIADLYTSKYRKYLAREYRARGNAFGIYTEV